jgi:hypothetical protein
VPEVEDRAIIRMLVLQQRGSRGSAISHHYDSLLLFHNENKILKNHGLSVMLSLFVSDLERSSNSRPLVELRF